MAAAKARTDVGAPEGGAAAPLLSFLLALRDGAWAAVPLPARVDPLTALQRRRIALQARSTASDYVGSRVGWWISEVRSQIIERDGGQSRGLSNLKRIISERGAVPRMARSLWERQQLLLRAAPYLSLLGA